MSPAYAYTDEYPHRSSQVPCKQQYQPWPGSVPPELRVDPSRYPVMQGWSCIGCHHNHPAPCHPCHNYMAVPSYYCYPPPCPPMFQPQSLHYWGAYSGSPEVSPAQQVPPPGYWVEQPKYEYDKNNAGQDHHCCGCPNHVCKPNAEKGMKIEEQEPNVETKEKDSSGENNSLAPIYMGNHPYPIVWVSPEFMKNFEGGKLPKRRMMDRKDGSYGMEHGAKPVKKEATQNSWFPLKMDKNFSPPEPVSDQKGSEDREDGQNRRQFPFPIIWIPSYDKQEEEDEAKDRKDNSLRSFEKAPSTFKIFPVHPSDSRDDESTEAGNNKKNSAQAESDKAGKLVKQNTVKSYTVKNSENRQGTDYSDKRVKDPMSTPGSKEKPSSPTKASKLPPVCLRVDPLQKRKSGGSRSPSPPDTNRGSSRDTSHKLEEAKVHDSPPHNESASDVTKKTEEVVKGIEVMGETRSNMNEVESRKDSNLGHFGAAKQDDKAGSWDEGSASLENAKVEVVGAEGDKMETCSAKKSLSDVQAASLIQSAYRGYEVRKWDSLKKLKQMARVRDEMVKIRKSIDVLTSGSEDLTDQKRLVIGESIMRLLLQLDSIQGLHPSLRDIRKSLARELVHLQSELDSLASKQSDESVKELSAASSKELRSHDVTHQHYEQAREMDGHLVQALPAENCDSRPTELEETQHQQSDSACDSALKVDEAMQDESVALCNTTSEEGDRSSECQASETCSEENIGDKHAEKLHTEGGGVARNEIEVVPTNQIGLGSPMPLGGGKDKVNAGGAENDIVNDRVCDEENINDASSDLAPRADIMNPVISGAESNIDGLAKLPSEIASDESHEPYEIIKQEAVDATCADNTDLVTACGESNIDVLAGLPAEILAEEIHVSHESMKREEADAETNLVLESCHSSPGTIEQPIAAEQDIFEASKETKLDEKPYIELQPRQLEVPEASLEGCRSIDAVPVPEDDSVEQVAKRETAFEDNVGFDGSNTPKDTEEVVQQTPVLDKDISSKVSEVPVKDGREDPEESCEEQELVDAEVTREPDLLEEKVVLVSHDQSVPGKTSELNRAASCEQHGAAVDANEKLIKENERLREMMEKLLEAGKNQQDVISDLTGRVQDLEKKLVRTKKMRARRYKAASIRSWHGKLSPDSKKNSAGDVLV